MRGPAALLPWWRFLVEHTRKNFVLAHDPAEIGERLADHAGQERKLRDGAASSPPSTW